MSAETVGTKLRLLRKEKRLTQDELASLIGVKRATLSNYEIDRRQPSLSDLKRFAEFFGVGLDFFGLASSDEALDIAARAKMLFSDPSVPAEKKERLFKDIMRLYLDLDRG